MGNTQTKSGDISRTTSPSQDAITLSDILPITLCDFDGIKALLARNSPFNLVSLNVQGYQGTVLSYALHKVIEQIPQLVSGKNAFDGESSPHLQIKAFLMIYDFCKIHVTGSSAEYFQTLVSKDVKLLCQKSDRQNVQSFIMNLVESYQYNSDVNEWAFRLSGFDLADNNTVSAGLDDGSHIINVKIAHTGLLTMIADVMESEVSLLG